MSKALLFLLGALAVCLPARELLEIKGDYLLYSYDFNYIYGQGNIRIKSKEWTIQAEAVEIDVSGRVALASRNCRVEAGKQKYAADMLEIDLETLSLRCTRFQERILSWTLPGQKKAAGRRRRRCKKIVSRDPETLKKSLVYFLNRRIVITGLYRVYGYQTTAFIEGVQSLSFKKFKLDKGAGTRRSSWASMSTRSGTTLRRGWWSTPTGWLEKPVSTGRPGPSTRWTSNTISLARSISARLQE